MLVDKSISKEQLIKEIRANKDCARYINKLIGENHDGVHFNYDTVVHDSIKEYGKERVAFVLAAQIVEHGDWDGRYSKENKEWAKKVVADERTDYICMFAHPVLIDKVASKVRTATKVKQQGVEMD